MTIRRATPADAHALAKLNSIVQQMHHDVAPEWFKPPEHAAAVDYFRDVLRSDVLHLFVVEADGAVRGYAMARLQEAPETALTYGGLVVELDQISVDPTYRSRGLGRQLIARVKSLAAEVGSVRLQLTVWEFNSRARQIFEQAGFAATMTRMLAESPRVGREPG